MYILRNVRRGTQCSSRVLLKFSVVTAVIEMRSADTFCVFVFSPFSTFYYFVFVSRVLLLACGYRGNLDLGLEESLEGNRVGHLVTSSG